MANGGHQPTDVHSAGKRYECSITERKSILCCRRTGPGRIVQTDRHGEDHWPVLAPLFVREYSIREISHWI